MFSKPAMTCFKYQVYLYGSEAITYLNVLLWLFTKPALMSHKTSPIPLYRQPSLPLYGSKTITHLEKNFSIGKLPYLCWKVKRKPVWLMKHNM